MDLGELTLKLGADWGDALSQLGTLKDALSGAFAPPDVSAVLGAFDQVSQAAQTLQGSVSAVDLKLPELDTSSVTDSLSSLRGEVQAVVDQFGSIQISMPSGSISAGSAAADMAAEVAQAFGSQPIPISISTETASSAAADVATEIAQSLGSIPLNIDTTAAQGELQGIQEQAQQLADAIGSGATVTTGGETAAPSIDTSAAEADLQKLAEDTATTVSEMQGDFAGAQLAAPDDSAVTAALSGLPDDAATAAQEMSSDLAGVALEAPDTTAIVDGIDAIGTAASGDEAPLDDLGQKIADLLASGEASTLADALAQAMADIGDEASTADGELAPVADSIEGIGTAAGSAAPQVDQLGTDTETAGEHATEAEGGFAGLAEAMVGLGEAAAITEGLKELGSEALNAADAMTHASIALTTITGDAEQTETTIKGLEDLAASDALSMPSLLTAATRMQQLLGAGADVPGIMASIANGAAVMGTDIGTAASAFDRIVNSGTVAARQLQQIGLNMDGLADALNTVNPALNATADTAAAAFKALDPGDRITVLQTALQGLAGTAQQVAQATFGGQWQILANQWEATMAQVGQALLPVITALTSFASEGLSVIQSMATAFNTLPGPVKDAAAAIAILVGSIVPITAGLAGFSLAVSGLSGVLTAAETGWTTIAGFFTSTGEAATAAVPEIAAMGTAAATAAPEVAAVGDAALAATPEITAMGEAALASAPEIEALGGAGVIGGIGEIGDAAAVAAPEVTALGEGAAASEASVGLLGGALGTAAIAIGAFALPLTAIVESGMLSEMVEGFSNLKTALDSLVWQPLVEGFDALKASVSQAADVGFGLLETTLQELIGNEFPQVKAALDQMAVSAKASVDSMSGWDLVVPGISGVTAALHQANIELAAYNNYIAMSNGPDIITRFGLLEDALNRISTASQNATNGASTYSDALQTLLAKQVSLVGNVGELQDAVNQAKAAFDAGQISAQQLAYVEGQLDSATKSLYGTAQAMPAAFDGWNSALATTSDDMKVLIDWENNLISAHDKMVQTIAQSGQTVAQFFQSLDDAAAKSADAFTALQDNAPNAILSIVDPLQRAGQAAKDAQAAFQSIFTTDPAPLNALAQAFDTLGVKASGAKPDLDTLNAALVTVLNDATVGWDDPRVIEALNNIDKAAQQVGKGSLVDLANELGTAVTDLNNSNAPIDLVASKMSQWEGTINKLAQTDLPDAMAQQELYIAQLVRMGAGLTAIANATITADQYQIKLANDAVLAGTAGFGASQNFVLGIEAINLQMQGSAMIAAGWSGAVIDGIKGMESAWDSMSQTIAQAIIQGTSFSDAWHKIAQTFETDILEGIIKGALAPLEGMLLKIIGELIAQFIPGFALGIGQQAALTAAVTAQTASQTALTAAITAQTAALTALVTAQGVAVGGNTALAGSSGVAAGALTALGVASSLASIAVTSLITAVAAVIGAIAGVVGDVYLAAIDTKLFTVETDLNGILNEALNLRKEQEDWFGQSFTRLGEIKNDCDTMLATLQAMYAAGQTGAGGGIGDHNTSSLDTIAQDSDYLVTGLQNINDSIQGLIQIAQGIQTATADTDQTTAAMSSFLYVIDKDIQAIASAILYGGHTQADAISSLADAVSLGAQDMVTATAQAASAITSSQAQTSGMIANAVLSPLPNPRQPPVSTAGGGVDAGGGRSVPGSDAAAQQQLALAQSALAAAMTLNDEITALQNEISADDQLMQNAIQSGDLTLAAQYQQAAQNATNQLVPLLSSTEDAATHIATSADNAVTAIGTLTTDSALYSQTASQLVSDHVDANATTISSAVYTSANNTASAFSAAITAMDGTLTSFGGGLSSPSNTYNGGGSFGTGGSTGSNLPNPAGTPTAPGGAGGIGGGYLPIASPTGPTFTPPTGTPTQTAVPYTGSQTVLTGHGGIPSYQTGGAVPDDTLANLDAGEQVLSPGLNTALQAFLDQQNASQTSTAGGSGNGPVDVTLTTDQYGTLINIQQHQADLLSQQVDGADLQLQLAQQNNAPPAMIDLLTQQLDLYQAQLDAYNEGLPYQQITAANLSTWLPQIQAAATGPKPLGVPDYTPPPSSDAGTPIATDPNTGAAASAQAQLALEKLSNDQQNLLQAIQSGNADQIAAAQAVLQVDQDNLAIAQDAAAKSGTSNDAILQAILQAQLALQNDQQQLLLATQSGNADQIAMAQAQLQADQTNLAIAQDAAASAAKIADTPPPTLDMPTILAALSADNFNLLNAIASGNTANIATANQQLAVDQAQLDSLNAATALAKAQASGGTPAAQLASLQESVRIAADNLLIAQQTQSVTSAMAANAPPDQIAALQQQLAVTNASLKVDTDQKALLDAIANGQLPSQLSVLEQTLATDKQTLAKISTGPGPTSTTPTGAAVTAAQGVVSTDQANLLAAAIAGASASTIVQLQAQYTLDQQLLVVAQDQDALAQAKTGTDQTAIALAQQQLSIGQDGLSILKDTQAISQAQENHSPPDVIAALQAGLKLANDQLAVDTATHDLTVAIANGNTAQLSVLEQTLSTAQGNLQALQTLASAPPPPPPPSNQYNQQPGFSGYNPYTTPIESGAQIPSFDLGGYVGGDMVAQLHAGEYVLSPDVVRASMSFGSGGGSSVSPSASSAISGAAASDSHDTYNFVLPPGTTDQIMREIAARVKQRSPKTRPYAS